MEMWEGALLIVGGIFLVGRLSRSSPSHPINSVSTVAHPANTTGVTTETHEDGSSHLVSGETLEPAPPLPHSNLEKRVIPISSPVTKTAPISTPSNPVFSPTPVSPKPPVVVNKPGVPITVPPTKVASPVTSRKFGTSNIRPSIGGTRIMEL